MADSKEFKQIVNDLYKHTQALYKAVTEENALLEKGKLTELKPILEKKAKAFEEFNISQEHFGEYSLRNDIDKADPQIEKLKKLLLDLDRANLDNKHLLQASKETSEMMIQQYKANKTKSDAMKSGYNEKGAFNSEKKNKVSSAASLSNKV